MSKKIPFGIALALVFAAIAVSVTVSVTVTLKKYNELILDLPQRTQIYSKLSDMEELVRANYYGEIDSDLLDANIAKGYIEGLQDPDSFYLSAEEYEIYKSVVSGDVTNIGIETSFDEKNSRLVVTDVYSGSSALKAGIQIGDIIKSVGNEAVTKDNYSRLTALFDSDSQRTVDLEVQRPASANASEKSFKANLEKSYKAVSCFYSVESKIGYVAITSFYDNTPELFSQALKDMTVQGISGIIIDVRNNSSLDYQSAAKVIDLIVPLATEGTGEIATAKNTKGEIVEIYSSNSDSVSLPIAVLINDRTEGAAELLACDLRDFGKAKLFGEKTAGHGSLQKAFPLTDGGAVVLTVAKIYPYISDCFDGVGVEPNEVIAMSQEDKDRLSLLDKSKDLQYKAALGYFS